MGDENCSCGELRDASRRIAAALAGLGVKQGDAVGAATFLQHVESMDPGNFSTHNLLAQAYKALGRTADASRELELTQKTQAAQEPHLSTLK